MNEQEMIEYYDNKYEINEFQSVLLRHKLISTEDLRFFDAGEGAHFYGLISENKLPGVFLDEKKGEMYVTKYTLKIAALEHDIEELSFKEWEKGLKNRLYNLLQEDDAPFSAKRFIEKNVPDIAEKIY